MTVEELKNNISSGENDTIEFKQSFGDTVTETLTALANTKGGKVCIGITDKLTITGVQVGKEMLQNWINEIKQKTSPAIIPDIEIVEIEDKNVVVFEIAEFPVKPVAFKGRYYKRVRNSNHRMTISEKSDAHIKTVNSSWDFYPDPEHSIENLSEEKIYNFMDQIGLEVDLITFLNKFEFLKNEKITFGTFLLFTNSKPLISTIEIGRFSSETLIKDSITIRDDLLTEVKQVLEFIRKHINKSYIITGKPQREERWEYPMDAIREIVVNMIVHRDYQSPDDSIIKIFNDRIEFFNPGKLIANLTIEQVISGKYRSHLRNKQIANIFKEAGIIEKYGTGIKRTIEAFDVYELKRPDFTETEGGFLVTVFNSSNSVGENVGENVGDNRLERIIKWIKQNNKISAKQLAQRLNVSNRTVERDIEKLKATNRLERIGGEKGGYWEVSE